MTMNAHSIYRIHLFFLASYLAVTALLWPRLPERIPRHFGATGMPTAWEETSLLSWFGLPLVAIVTALFVYGVGRWAMSDPAHWNIPYKERFLQLPTKVRAPIIDRMERMIAITGLAATISFAGVQIGSYQTAVGHSSGLSWYSLFIIIVPCALLVLWTVQEAGRIGQAVKELTEREPGG
jgi:hypothetical protein